MKEVQGGSGQSHILNLTVTNVCTHLSSVCHARHPHYLFGETLKAVMADCWYKTNKLTDLLQKMCVFYKTMHGFNTIHTGEYYLNRPALLFVKNKVQYYV